MENKMILAQKIKEYRVKIGYSQEQFAQKLGVTRQTISNWERGTSIPDATKLNEMSVLFQISMDALVDSNFNESCDEEGAQTNKVWQSLMIFNIIMTAIMIGFHCCQQTLVIKEILIPAGPPILISIIVWSVIEYALKSKDFTMIGGYNSKNSYNYSVLCKMVKFIQGYIVLISFIANFVLCILSAFPDCKEYYIYIFFIYLVNFFTGVIYINIRYKRQLYIA